ncbi:MAG: glucose-6-phosphate isomerase [Actinobacteria bacterium]|nr:glucose-6-phosphate isomerase [Actinomycetota bacterium]
MTTPSELWKRLERRDATLWADGNVSATRLGWLDSPARMQAEAKDLAAWAGTIDADHIVLLGMGGSSLGPEVLRAAVDSDRLIVLDTTDPATIAGTPLGNSFFLVSSKSGTTLEVQTLLAHCWERVPDPARYAAITDPGTPLATLANERGFARLFENQSDIGGRYSVLSYFGIVPAALLGYDVAALCESALGADREAAVERGIAMGEAAREGRDKVTVVVPEKFRHFGLWVEQLIAESTGKRGTGCVPVPTTEVEHGPDRHVIGLELSDALELGNQFFTWEVATAIAGHVLEIDPFDEPNVTESKQNTAKVLEHLPLPAIEADDPATVSAWLEGHVRPKDYVSIQAYLPYGQDDALDRLRRALRDGLGGCAVTCGYGPRFLHSTGQLHKGGPDEVVAVQVVPRQPTAELPIPGHPYDFGTLIAAQALGDHQSLLDHGRRVVRVAVDSIDEIR